MANRRHSPEHMERPRRRGEAGRDTNSNDTHSLRCRVFVGNLSNDKTTKAEIEEMFEKFGQVASCSLHNNFGFIQYCNDKDADAAVSEMHGKVLYGKRIDVNLAGLRRKPQSKDVYEGAPPIEEVVPADALKSSSSGRPPARNRERSPLRGDRDTNYGRGSGGYERPYDGYDRPHPDRPVEYPGDRRMETYGYARRDEQSYVRDYRDAGHRRTMDEPRAQRQPLRPAIDCEIVSLSKEETRYAEEVESRLRSIGLVCNIGFPPPELPIPELMDRIARTGTLYAVVVTSQNAIHRSCTLNILHGTRQEHRNMPLDDALSFVARNFDAYLRVMRDPIPPPRSSYLPPASRSDPRAPQPQQLAAGYPSQGKDMSTDELTALIEKLKKEKEEREAAGRGTSSAAKPPTDHERHAELGSQIRDEPQQPPLSDNYTYNNYPQSSAPVPTANGSQASASLAPTPAAAASEGYYQQPQHYEQPPLYR